MKVGVSISINMDKIEEFRLFKGKKGTYLNMTTFIDVDNKDQYDNNGFISQDVSKEERNRGVKGPILGNCKVFYNDSEPSLQQQVDSGAVQSSDFDDDIPFS